VGRAIAAWGLLILFARMAWAADCTHDEVQRTRASAERQMTKKDYKGAVATLRGLACALFPDGNDPIDGPASTVTVDYFWYQSDLAFALYKAGDPVGCMRITAHALLGHPDGAQRFFRLDAPVVKAIEHNYTICHAAHEERFGTLTGRACAGDERPSAAVDGGCLIAGCQTSVRRSRQRDEAPLAVDGGPLVDKGWCCTINALSVGTWNGKTMVRVQSAGLLARPCGGGTAQSWVDALYELRGGALRLVEDNHVGVH
jgi:hypothetical protein